jgi:hypothetical protein
MGRPAGLALCLAIAVAMGCNAVAGLDALRFDAASDSAGSVGAGGTVGEGGDGGRGGGGNAAGCSDAICARSAGDCQSCTCLEGVVCDCDPIAFGTRCAGGYCDSDGSCVPCLNDVRYGCMDGSSCITNMCVHASCTDNLHNRDETGLDCGGSCTPCANGEGCAAAADCLSGLCLQLSCSPCTMNGDCGPGHYCSRASCGALKGPFEACSFDYECASGNCICIGAACGCGT